MKLRLFSSDDRALAARKYSGRESATDTASRQRRQGHRRAATATARQGQAWEDADRARETSRNWWRGGF